MSLGCLLPRTRFAEYLVGHNNLDERGFVNWIFHPGMLFNSTDVCDGKGNQLYSIYGHTELCNGLDKGKTFHEGDVIATIKDPKKKKVDIMPHLHLSLAWVPKSFPYNKLNWKTISDPGIVTLLNPLEFIVCKYTVLKDV
jgi:hypothetical protein